MTTCNDSKTMAEETYTNNITELEWQADDTASLLFVYQNQSVLLIRKKRGLGAGKINGPGGKQEAHETIMECAIREVQEELRITPTDIQARGELRFSFTDGYKMHVHLFVAGDFTGTPTETDEAIPLWFGINELPFDEMWADDRLWLSRVLNGESVDGTFNFDGDRMLEHNVSFS